MKKFSPVKAIVSFLIFGLGLIIAETPDLNRIALLFLVILVSLLEGYKE